MSPNASIIYLTKNGGAVFERSLDAVCSQSCRFEYEVIVVDSGSTDGTLSVARKYPVKLHRIRPEEFNFGLTRDHGFELAKGEILIALSQDAVPNGPDWLDTMVSAFKDSSIAVVQAMETAPKNTDLFYWERIRMFYFTRESRKWIRAHDGIGLSFTCCAIRRIVWEENRLGRVEMSEDKVFQQKITDKGLKIACENTATYFHSHMYDTRSLARRCENEGLGWRGVGHEYSLFDMFADLLNPSVHAAFLYGLLTFRIKRLAELVFPVVRPVYLYKGNHFSKSYVK